jgi:hypothetical protein
MTKWRDDGKVRARKSSAPKLKARVAPLEANGLCRANAEFGVGTKVMITVAVNEQHGDRMFVQLHPERLHCGGHQSRKSHGR